MANTAKIITALILIFVVNLVRTPPVHATSLAPGANTYPTTMPCAETRAVIFDLAFRKKLTFNSWGVRPSGEFIQLWTDKDGNFVLIMVQPGGLTCYLATGSAWEPVKKGTNIDFTPASEIPEGLGHPNRQEVPHWYDASCCSARDCEPLPFNAVAQVPEGYRVRYRGSLGLLVDVLVPWNLARRSQDGQNHGCASKVRFFCLYVSTGA